MKNTSCSSVEIHAAFCRYLNDLYARKNSDYGDSFHDTYNKFGIISALIRISDKYNRIVSLCANSSASKVQDESVRDTLLDMANYCIMTAMELTDNQVGNQERIQDNRQDCKKTIATATVPTDSGRFKIINGTAYTRSAKAMDHMNHIAPVGIDSNEDSRD